MSHFKALGPDGIHAGFYQNTWETVGDSVCKFALNFFTTGYLLEGANDTQLVLIPKVNHPENFTQLRQISLCNVIYKVITKTMTNRLNMIMPSLTAQNQSSFIPGCQIVDNIIIYQEALHSMRNRRTETGLMTIKIDMEKAYDRLSWGFIKDTLKMAGFPPNWVSNIMHCIETSRLAVLWNGKQLEWFKLEREIR